MQEIYIENSLARDEQQDLQGFDKRYHNIVHYILDITHAIWEDKDIGLLYDTYAEDIIIHLNTVVLKGREGVIKGTLDVLQTFPDRVPFGEEVIWSYEQGDKYFSSHRLQSQATHLGESAYYGKPTGKKVFYRGIADCVIYKNKIEKEWLIRDNYHLLVQLGLSPIELAKKSQSPRLNISNEELKSRDNLKSFNQPNEQASVNCVLSLFKDIFKQHRFGQVSELYHKNAVLHGVCGKDYHGASGVKDFYVELFSALPNPEVRIERITCNRNYLGDKVAVRWTLYGNHTGDGIFGSPSGKTIELMGITHYEIWGGKIEREWVVFDIYNVLCQIYGQSELAQENDNTQKQRLSQKQIVLNWISKMNNSEFRNTPMDKLMGEYWAEDSTLDAGQPFGKCVGTSHQISNFWKPLYESFPDLEHQPYILVGGTSLGKNYVCTAGNMVGTFEKEWVGIAPTKQATWIRYHACFQIDEHFKIAKAWYILDILGFLQQVGKSPFSSRGAGIIPPGPVKGDGIVTYSTKESDSIRTYNLTEAMINGLLDYDGKTLASMGQERFWDVNNMMWYGPAGIGTTKGLKGFETYHQIPFLKGFPNRGSIKAEGQDGVGQFADGYYQCYFGIPGMHGTHLGNDWLGLSATGKPVTISLIDFWRREDRVLKENWVMIDMIDLLNQLGVDVLGNI